MSIDEFGDIVEELQELNYKEIEVDSVVYNASVSAALMIPHGPDCTCDPFALYLSLKVQGRDPIEILVPPTSPLGIAFLSGEFARICQERLDNLLVEPDNGN